MGAATWRSELAYALAMTGLLLGLAMLSYHLFEKHFFKLKKYFATAARSD